MEPGNIWLLLVIAAVSFVLSFIGSSVGLVLGHLRLPLLIAYMKSPGGGAAMNLIISGTGIWRVQCGISAMAGFPGSASR